MGRSTSPAFPMKIQVGAQKRDVNSAIYVSTSGDDSNSGSKDQPLATMQRAKELVKQRGAKLVYFRGGEWLYG